MYAWTRTKAGACADTGADAYARLARKPNIALNGQPGMTAFLLERRRSATMAVASKQAKHNT